MRLSILLVASLACAQVSLESNEHAIVKRHGDHEDSDQQHTKDGSSSSPMDMGMDMKPSPAAMSHHHGRPVLDDPNLEPQQRQYWEQYSTVTFFNSEEGNKFLLWSHTILAVMAYGFMAPVSLLTSGDSRAQWFYIPFQTAQTFIGLLSILFFALYSATAPKLYPGNSYSGFSIAMVALEMSRWMAVVLRAITKYMAVDEYSGAYIPADDEASERFVNDYARRNYHSRNMPSMSSAEFGSGSETDVSSFDMERGDLSSKPMMGDDDVELKGPHPPVSSGFVRRLASNQIFATLNRLLGGMASCVYYLLNYPMFFVGYAYLLTGLSTAFVMGQGHHVFALLAHFIKGFVFYTLGFLELARFLGAGASRGWSWNEVYVPKESLDRPSRLYILQYIWPRCPSMEFIQSFLIFFYGATNVFMEHLGNNDGGKWSHKDLQHASIAFMFFGGGLCGLVLESETVRSLIETSFGLQNAESMEASQNNAVRRGWSRNPMPAFIVFWTGALMSHHEQETPLSTQIHIQWGTMLSLGAVFRLLTLFLLTVKPRAANACAAECPQRPFTEVIVSFFLVCGGMIFMASNRETVEGMIYRGLDQMFTLNVSVGIAVLMMSYFVGCVAVKGWASSRY